MGAVGLGIQTEGINPGAVARNPENPQPSTLNMTLKPV